MSIGARPSIRQHAEHRDLAIVDLLGDTDRAGTLFGEADLSMLGTLVGLPIETSKSRPIRATRGSCPTAIR